MSPVGRQPVAPPPIDVDLRVEVLPPVGRGVAVDRSNAPPIFVVGDRSGRLGTLLDSHREISFAPGLGLLSALVRAVTGEGAALARYGYPDQYWLQSIARYYDGLQRDLAARRGGTRWAGAAPGDDVEFVDRLYPRCQILHVTGERGARSAGRRARSAGRRMLAGRYLEVPAAALRLEPQTALRSVLAFLGEA
jgi:hypothetical protein